MIYIQYYLKLFVTVEKYVKFCNLFYGENIILIPKSEKTL